MIKSGRLTLLWSKWRRVLPVWGFGRTLPAAIAHPRAMRRSRTPGRGELGKVTIVELLWVTLLIGGAAAGVTIGHAQFGVWGGAIGLPVGLGVGLLLCSAIAYFLNLVMRSKSPTARKTGRR